MGKFKNLFVVHPEPVKIDNRKQKSCSICGVFKFLEDFPPRKDSPDKRSYNCRDCRNAYKRQMYALNPNFRKRQIEEAKRWNTEHREQFNSNMRNYQHNKRYGVSKETSKNQPDITL